MVIIFVIILFFFAGVLMFMGFWFLLITTLVGIFKKENDSGLEDGQLKISIIQNYKLIWYILKIPSMNVFILILLTSWVNIFQFL